MIRLEDAKIETLALHFVGNKNNDEPVYCSKSTMDINGEMELILVNYFSHPFTKAQEFYNFYHDSDLKYNEVYGFVSEIFDNPESLLEQSKNLAKHLYEQSVHPKIKGGEFYVVFFEDCIVEGEAVDAVGLFKSENKDTFLKVLQSEENFDIESEQGININKLDKGCLIFNKEQENGFMVSIVDNTNKGIEAQYWIDDFLHIRQRKDEYYNTQNLLSLTKHFIKDELPQQFDISKADQVDLLNKSVKFFKENDSFDMENFTNEVISQPEVIQSFNHYKKEFQENFDVEIIDNFSISESAVKKQARILKSVIKLDKNFHIYIHGDRELIEQGEDNKGKFYKVYYKEEN